MYVAWLTYPGAINLIYQLYLHEIGRRQDDEADEESRCNGSVLMFSTASCCPLMSLWTRQIWYSLWCIFEKAGQEDGDLAARQIHV